MLLLGLGSGPRPELKQWRLSVVDVISTHAAPAELPVHQSPRGPGRQSHLPMVRLQVSEVLMRKT